MGFYNKYWNSQYTVIEKKKIGLALISFSEGVKNCARANLQEHVELDGGIFLHNHLT